MATPEEQAYFSTVARIRWEKLYGAFPPLAQRIEELRLFVQRTLGRAFTNHPLNGAIWRWDHHYLTVLETARTYDSITNAAVETMLADARSHHWTLVPPETTAEDAIIYHQCTVVAHIARDTPGRRSVLKARHHRVLDELGT
jgi:hypothetical protein